MPRRGAGGGAGSDRTTGSDEIGKVNSRGSLACVSFQVLGRVVVTMAQFRMAQLRGHPKLYQLAPQLGHHLMDHLMAFPKG